MGHDTSLGDIQAQSRVRVARGEDHVSIDPPNRYPGSSDELPLRWRIRREDGLLLLLCTVQFSVGCDNICTPPMVYLGVIWLQNSCGLVRATHQCCSFSRFVGKVLSKPKSLVVKFSAARLSNYMRARWILGFLGFRPCRAVAFPYHLLRTKRDDPLGNKPLLKSPCPSFQRLLSRAGASIVCPLPDFHIWTKA